MITHKTTNPLLRSLFRETGLNSSICLQCRRLLHQNVSIQKIPQPTPFVPDVPTFLSLIGRELSKHASKFKSWDDLFSASSTMLKERGIEPPRTRRYLLRWCHKFRKGEYGTGGDFKYVKDGIAELKVVEIPTIRNPANEAGDEKVVSISRTPGMAKLIVNIPNGANTYRLENGQTTKDLRKPKGLTLRDGHIIVGSYVQPVKGTNGSAAVLKVTEGMWEDRRGHKVHGGERRRAETLHKLRITERKNAR